MMYSDVLIKRLENKLKVTDNGCIEFTGFRRRGYGVISINGKKTVFVHRVVATNFLPNFKDTDVVRHTCDNPPCCNPQHLKLGTQQDNLQDARDRERAKAGSQWEPLHPSEIEDMAAARALGLTIRQIADLTGRSATTVHRHLTLDS